MFREITIVFLLRIILAAIVFITDIILAHLLGPEGKGYYYILIITPAIIGTVSTFGLDYSINFYGHRKPEQLFSVFSTASLSGLTIMAIFAIPLIFNFGKTLSLLYKGLPVGYRSIESLSLFIVPVEMLFILTTMFAMTGQRPVLYGQMRIVRRAFVLIGIIFIVVFFKLTSQLTIFSFVTIQVLSIAFSVIFCLKRSGFRWSYDKFSSISIMSEGLKAYPARLSEKIQARIGAVILGILGSGTDVGIYSVSMMVSESLYLFSGSVSAVLFSENIRDSREKYLQVFRLMIPFMLMVSILTGIGGNIAIPWVYGDEFSFSANLLWYLIPSIIFLSMVQIITPYMVQLGLSRIISASWIVGLIINVGLNLLLVPAFKSIGVAVSASISCGLILIIILLWASKVEGKSPGDFLLMKNGDILLVKSLLNRFCKFHSVKTGPRD